MNDRLFQKGMKYINHSKPLIEFDDYKAVEEQLKTGMLADGKAVHKFENRIQEYLNVDKAFATTSGTAALIVALLALEVNKGDEVILPSYVCKSVLNAVLHLGAKPVLVDIGDFWVINRETVSSHITKKTKAIIAVHTFGVRCDIENLKELGISVIEDVCQALGLQLDNNSKAGSAGDISIFSFHATKCLSTGEGGMVATNNKKLADIISAFRDRDLPHLKMTNIQAAMGINQINKYDNFLSRRIDIANKYLDSIPHEAVGMMKALPKTIYFRFLLTIARDFREVKDFFHKNGIAVRKGVDNLLHKMMGLPDKQFINSVKLFDNTVSIPIYPALTNDEVEYIIDITNKYLLK